MWVDVAVKLLIAALEVLVSNPGRDTGYPEVFRGLPQSFNAYTGI
jgi:hypothetical protein